MQYLTVNLTEAENRTVTVGDGGRYREQLLTGIKFQLPQMTKF